jgi:hypothetical protein
LHHSSLDFLGSGLVTIVMSQFVPLLRLIVEQLCIVGICTCAALVWNYISARFSKYVRVIWYSIAEKIYIRLNNAPPPPPDAFTARTT